MLFKNDVDDDVFPHTGDVTFISEIMRQIRSVCSRSLPKRVMSSLVAALVLTRLDGGNAMLAGLPARQLNRLQHVLHTAA